MVFGFIVLKCKIVVHIAAHFTPSAWTLHASAELKVSLQGVLVVGCLLSCGVMTAKASG